MMRWFSGNLLVATLLVLLATVGVAQMTNESREKPAAVPLDFLEWIERDVEWLESQLATIDAGQITQISANRLESESVDVLRAANRIRAFAHLGVSTLRLPYFDLPMRDDQDLQFRCVTLFPRSIVPEIGAMDFDEEAFTSENADPAILDMCRLKEAELAEYADLPRQALRQRFFDNNGDLKVEFVHLNHDPALVATLIDRGFFVYQGDVTGRIKIEP